MFSVDSTENSIYFQNPYRIDKRMATSYFFESCKSVYIIIYHLLLKLYLIVRYNSVTFKTTRLTSYTIIHCNYYLNI